MSKGKKIVLLCVLMILTGNAFAFCQAHGPPEVALFCAILTVGLLAGIVGVGLSRTQRPRR
jgi:hypothetical protein